MAWRSDVGWREFVLAVAIVGIATLIALALRPYLAATNLAMVYLLGVVVVATRCSRRVSVMASFLSVAAFRFFLRASVLDPGGLRLRVLDHVRRHAGSGPGD